LDRDFEKNYWKKLLFSLKFFCSIIGWFISSSIFCYNCFSLRINSNKNAVRKTFIFWCLNKFLVNNSLIIYLELISAISRTIRSDGYSALWRGWTATMLRDIPFSGVFCC